MPPRHSGLGRRTITEALEAIQRGEAAACESLLRRALGMRAVDIVAAAPSWNPEGFQLDFIAICRRHGLDIERAAYLIAQDVDDDFHFGSVSRSPLTIGGGSVAKRLLDRYLGLVPVAAMREVLEQLHAAACSGWLSQDPENT